MTTQNFVTLHRKVVEQLVQGVSNYGLISILQTALTEQVQPAQGELENLLDMYWDLAYAEGHSHGKESYGTKANETRHKIRAILKANEERVPLSNARIDEMWQE